MYIFFHPLSLITTNLARTIRIFTGGEAET
jgi:hypothetical protein